MCYGKSLHYSCVMARICLRLWLSMYGELSIFASLTFKYSVSSIAPMQNINKSNKNIWKEKDVCCIKESDCDTNEHRRITSYIRPKKSTSQLSSKYLHNHQNIFIIIKTSSLSSKSIPNHVNMRKSFKTFC